jgi:hypothetical protein
MRKKPAKRQQDNRNQYVPADPLEAPDSALKSNVLIDWMSPVLHFRVMCIHQDGRSAQRIGLPPVTA